MMGGEIGRAWGWDGLEFYYSTEGHASFLGGTSIDSIGCAESVFLSKIVPAGRFYHAAPGAANRLAGYLGIPARKWGIGLQIEAYAAFDNMQSGFRFFFGAAAAAPGATVNPSSLTSIVGFGCDATDSNLQLMFNDASGTATKVDTGYARPAAIENSGALSLGTDVDVYQGIFTYVGAPITSAAPTGAALRATLSVMNPGRRRTIFDYLITNNVAWTADVAPLVFANSAANTANYVSVVAPGHIVRMGPP